jgi:threonylcarbamoyladenosine tRNA methylthiotransferase MtaB
MSEICSASEREFLQSQIGQTVSVLFETKEGEYWTGYTENYTKVFVKASNINEGDILSVKITACKNDICFGELI